MNVKQLKEKLKNVDESLDVQIFHDSKYECLKDLTQVYIPDKQDKKLNIYFVQLASKSEVTNGR